GSHSLKITAIYFWLSSFMKLKHSSDVSQCQERNHIVVTGGQPDNKTGALFSLFYLDIGDFC
ncbi:hypothetical protein NL320_26615, partial [Klebsiella pneumoniae]|nr:hypothetical protein [Klebsiella pneumoniae]